MHTLFLATGRSSLRHLALPVLTALLLTNFCPVCGRAESVIHWTNSASQDGASVVNSGAIFTTDFKGSNDIQISKPTGPNVDIYPETLGGDAPGNNPAWVTNFVGSTAEQTGDGTPGRWKAMEMSSSANTEQFDFSIPFGPGDRMMVFDVDNTEKYQIVAYKLVGGNYVAVSLNGWGHQSFSGETGITPDERWPVWSSSDGTLTASGSSLTEPLDVLTPDQNIDRVVFIGFGNGSGTPAVQFAANISQVNLIGDYNHNGVVDAADYVLWRNTLGQSGSNLAADGNQNNSIDSGDYTVWRSHFGQTAASGSALTSGQAVAVPEPKGAALLLSAVALGLSLRTLRRMA